MLDARSSSLSSPPPAAESAEDFDLTALREVIERHWGYREFRPLQAPAMRAMLEGRDSVVVMPTGGGKSLCYQAPALLREGTTVVVSPLISLMKDQVDGLVACGINAAQIDSSQTARAKRELVDQLRLGQLKLLFVSPERLCMPNFQDLLRQAGVSAFAIDEAHCISHWGHDFRPEYRQLHQLKQLFPGCSVHAFTATATEHVRQDIAERLHLENPELLVGNFDRPNLSYRIVGRRNELQQICEVLERHPNEAGIVYCIRRKDVDELTTALNARGIKAMSYHAGLTNDQRHAAQDAFLNEECDLIVATVAFGMGIDRSNIRFVIHAAMPKSIEHYQQETGRAGRDGLEAECVLLYSGQDAILWKSIVEKSAAEAEGQVDPDYVPNALGHINDMDRYCRGAVCRHRTLVEYFGQKYVPPGDETQNAKRKSTGGEATGNGQPATGTDGALADAAAPLQNSELRIQNSSGCGACDLCLGLTAEVPDATVLAQKILSCVARVQERFGIVHVIGVLRGENTERIRKCGHESLSTFGLLSGLGKAELRDYIYQLLSQGLLRQEGDEYPVLRLTKAAWEVMKGQRPVRLVEPVRKPEAEKKSASISWEGVDRGLFEELRILRRDLAHQKNVPPYVVYSDATLRELARIRPSTLEKLRLVYGIGEAKLAELGERTLGLITGYCQKHGLAMDQAHGLTAQRFRAAPGLSGRANPTKQQARDLFAAGATLDEVIQKTGRARSTVGEYLAEFIYETRPASLDRWVPAATYARVADAAHTHGIAKLKPIYDALNGTVGYDEIRWVLAHLADPAE